MKSSVCWGLLGLPGMVAKRALKLLCNVDTRTKPQRDNHCATVPVLCAQTKANDVRKEIRIGFTRRRRLMPYVGLEDRIDRAY